MSNFTLFTLTIIPLVLTPGPDMLFVISQAIGKNFKSGMMATFGVCSGYLVHSVLVALGISAIIVSYPMLFNAIRFLGIAYLMYLSVCLFRSVIQSNGIHIQKTNTPNPIRKGFITSLLNPKVMLIYFAILPQFMTAKGNTVIQGLELSFIFIGLCIIVYLSVAYAFVKMTQKAGFDQSKQRWLDATSGTMIMLAATWLIAH
ncbi:LysE family translocator [Acinetobacter sp. MD2(2019)]|uniref:LysE family translocator n=1 Tax=Acinetobacter sp. MD2(2019) TaxID=2605273 RepID=UPI002D1EBECD|nr:LysE family translocator [Acinetobacter sp. MD2(2019)]MEB3754018.1 LysE family translocator [Acinetobacter sp. MD2(2019)]